MSRSLRITPALLALAIATPASQPAAAQQIPTGFPAACQPGEVQVMLLGTWHFEGSGNDGVRAAAEDVLTPQRQAELEALADRLQRWAPEQIAVEWPYTFADSTTARYQRYVADGTSDRRNEVVQIGFRLARRLGHPTVHPIDHQMPIGNDSTGPLMARRPDLRQRSDNLQALLQARSDSARAHHGGASIVERLREANTEQALRGGNSQGMFGSWLAAGEGGNLGGPRLLARWYERNIIMAHYLTRVLRPETRRVLVLVGSGHVPPLRAILDESPDFCPVSPLPYLQ